MRRHLPLICAALLAAGLGWSTQAHAQPAAIKGIVPETCGDYGTNVHFEKNPKEAAKKAADKQKLVLVIHISGHFEDPNLT